MPRFLQIHTLTSYPGSLLNRDDVGFAKRLPFGGADRVRISSQCLKRHWRTTEDELSLANMSDVDGQIPFAVRSRKSFERFIYHPLVENGVDSDVARVITGKLIETVLPESKRKQAAKKEDSEDEEAGELHTGQVTVIGRPELEYLLKLAIDATEGAEDAKAAEERWKEIAKGDFRKNLQALRRGAGLDAALFGRMVTGDVLARCDAAVHVAHSFTVHPGFFETDYFSAVDDLNPAGETGSGHINTSELTSGLYYGYIVVDVPLLVSNIEGCPREEWRSAQREVVAEVVRRLVHLVSTVSPGAKLGATAPYASALMVLVEDGSAQPRTLANAFLDPVRATGSLLEVAQQRLAKHISNLDDMYGMNGERRFAAIEPPTEMADWPRLDLPTLAQWAAGRVQAAE